MINDLIIKELSFESNLKYYINVLLYKKKYIYRVAAPTQAESEH